MGPQEARRVDSEGYSQFALRARQQRIVQPQLNYLASLINELQVCQGVEPMPRVALN